MTGQDQTPRNGIYPAAEAAYGGGDSTAANDEVDLGSALRAIWHRKFWILLIVAAVTGLAVAYVNQLIPLYTAEMKLLAFSRGERIVDIPEVVADRRQGALQDEGQVMQTEIQVLKSRLLAWKVIKHLGLQNDPEFNFTLPPTRPPPITIKRLFSMAQNAVTGLFGKTAPAAPVKIDPDILKDAIITNFVSRISVRQVGISRILTVSFRSEDPEKAARIVDLIGETYVKDQVVAKVTATRSASEWLEKRLADMKRSLEEAETRVENYRERTGLTQAQGGRVSEQQLAELSTQLVLARAERARAEARYAQLRRILKSDKAETIPEVLASGLIQNYRTQETALLRELSVMMTRYRETDPLIKRLRADLGKLREKIREEIVKTVEAYKNEVDIARSREVVLQKSLNDLRERASNLNRAEVQLRTMTREVDVNRTMYQQFLSRLKQTEAQEELTRPDARIVSTAVVPLRPSYPKKGSTIGLALFASLFFTCIAVLIFARLDRTIRSAQQAESLSGVRVLGLVPEVATLDLNKSVPNRARSFAFPVQPLRWAAICCAATIVFFSPVASSGVAEARVIIDNGVEILAFLGLGGLAIYLGAVPQRHRSYSDTYSLTATESMRTICSGIVGSRGASAPESILVTSSVPEEGKTVIAASLGQQFARSGMRCLVIDCDIRRSRIDEVFERPNDLGLVDVLLDEKSPEDVIQKGGAAAPDLMLSGARDINVAVDGETNASPDRVLRLATSERMEKLLKDLSGTYDVIVIDSPPLMSIADARLLSKIVDETVMVVRWGKTPQSVMLTSLKHLVDVGAEVKGLVLSRVDPVSYAKGGYADSYVMSSEYYNYG